MSPYSQKLDVFPFPFFQNRNLILFPLLDSTDASRIHSDNKPRGEENQSVLMKRKFSGELSVSRNTTLEEKFWYELFFSHRDPIEFNQYGNFSKFSKLPDYQYNVEQSELIRYLSNKSSNLIF